MYKSDKRMIFKLKKTILKMGKKSFMQGKKNFQSGIRNSTLQKDGRVSMMTKDSMLTNI